LRAPANSDGVGDRRPRWPSTSGSTISTSWTD